MGVDPWVDISPYFLEVEGTTCFAPSIFGADIFCTNAHSIHWLIGALFDKFSQLILMKIIKIVAIRCQICKAKMHQKFNFSWGSTPDPAGGAYSAPQTPSWT